MQNNHAYHTNFCRIDRLKFVEIGKDDHPPCAHFKNASASLGAVFDKRSESSNITSPGWMSREVLQCSLLRKRAPLSPASSKNISSTNEETKFSKQRGSLLAADTATATVTRTRQVRSADSPGRENHGMRKLAPEYSSERE